MTDEKQPLPTRVPGEADKVVGSDADPVLTVLKKEVSDSSDMASAYLKELRKLPGAPEDPPALPTILQY